MKDIGMILILYLKSCPDIGSPTQLNVVHCVSEWLTIPASGHGRLLLLPWSVLATQNCTAVNWSHRTVCRQQDVRRIRLTCLTEKCRSVHI